MTPSGDWLFVTGEGARFDPSSLPEAFAAPPATVASGGVLLPTTRNDNALCRICWDRVADSREHVPPESAGNRGAGRSHSIQDWLARDESGGMDGGRHFQGGVRGWTLCRTCNSVSGRFATEYRRWAAACVRMLRALPDSFEVLDSLETLRELVIELHEARPSAFARQVLASLCTVAGSWELTRRHPEIRELVLSGAPGALPEGMELAMGLCLGPDALFAGPSLQVHLPTREWRWIAVVAFPPFAFELTLAASWEQPQALCGIHGFLHHDASAIGTVELDVPVLFSHAALPGEWRNSYQLEHGLDIYGAPDGGTSG